VETSRHRYNARGVRRGDCLSLKADPEIKVVICTGQADTEGAGLAIERHFRGKGYRAAGFDLSPGTLRLIKAGHIQFTIDQQPYIQGYYPVIQLALYCRYGNPPVEHRCRRIRDFRRHVDRFWH